MPMPEVSSQEIMATTKAKQDIKVPDILAARLSSEEFQKWLSSNTHYSSTNKLKRCMDNEEITIVGRKWKTVRKETVPF